jgi:hypothetical protein
VYPNQQQYPPQQPYQPQPQYGAPQGTPWMPPQYGGAPAQPPAAATQPPQLGGQQPPTAAPALGQSSQGGGGPKAPAPRHLIGRTVIIEPIRIDETTTAKDQQGNVVSRPTAYYHLTVVDGGPLQYGDNRDHDISKQHGMTMEVQTPVRFTNVQSDRWGIVQEVRDCMARNDMATVGVVQQGTKGNKPFLVTKCAKDLDGNERPDGGERFDRATQVWNEIFAKRFVSPEPRSLVAPPAQQPPQVAYQPTPATFPQHITQQGYGVGNGYQPQAQAGYAQQQYQQTGTVPTPYGAAPAGQLHPEYVAAATQPAYNPGPAPQQPAYGQTMAAWGETYQPPAVTPQVQQMPQPAPVTVQPNPAFEAWLATLPPEQQAAQRAALAGAAAQPQQPAGPGF